MDSPGPTIRLNSENPFMQAVTAAAKGQASIDHAVKLLMTAEQRHEVFILGDPFYSVVDGMNTLRMDGKAPSALEVMSLIKVGRDAKAYSQRSTVSEEEWCSTVLYPFLSEVPLLVAGGDLCNDFCIISRGPMLFSSTWRHWGEILAGWANRTLPPSDGIKPWGYLDFYMDYHVSKIFPEYPEWIQVVRRVLSESADQWTRSLPEPAQ